MSEMVDKLWREATEERKAREYKAAAKAAAGRLLSEREQMDCYAFIPAKAFVSVAFFWSRLRPEYRWPLSQALRAVAQGGATE